MTIYKDHIAQVLGISSIYEHFPDWNLEDGLDQAEPWASNNFGENNAFYGKKHTNETRKAMKKAWQNPERRKLVLSVLHSKEAQQKSSKTLKETWSNTSQEEKTKRTANGLSKMNALKECSYCGIITNSGNIARYHEENCKHKSVDISVGDDKIESKGKKGT